MTETILAAESGIQVGHHTEAHWFGLTVNTDTVLATAIAAVIVLGLAFFLRAKVTSTGVPGGVQLFWEAITTQTRTQIENAIGMKIAPFVLPLAVTLFVFILVANWISVLPVQYTDSSGAIHELLKPPASDINFVLALALFVFICYHAAGFWRRGPLGHPWRVLKGHVAILAPDQHRRGARQADLVVAPALRQHLRRRHPGGADRALPAVHHVAAQRDMEELRLVRRRDPGVHLRPTDDLVLQPVDGARGRPSLATEQAGPTTW